MREDYLKIYEAEREKQREYARRRRDKKQRELEIDRVRPHIGKHSKLWSITRYKSEAKQHPKELYVPIVNRLSRYMQADIRKGLYDNNLSFDWFLENIWNKPCVYCGTTSRPIGADRIDNTKGHTRENCIPSCGICNTTRKDTFTVDEFKKIGVVISEIMQHR